MSYVEITYKHIDKLIFIYTYTLSILIKYPSRIPIIAIGEVFTKEDIILLNDFKDKIKGIKIIDNEIFLEVVQDETEVIRDNIK